MPTVRTRTKPAPLVVCIESFSSGDSEYGGCARGMKLRADHPIVKRRPQFFADAGLADDELDQLRRKFWADSGAPPPPRQGG
jgi:hypothetical protein